MEIEIARKLVNIYQNCETHLNELLEAIEEIEDPAERGIMRRKGANLIADMYVEIMRPIEIEHPTLKL